MRRTGLPARTSFTLLLIVLAACAPWTRIPAPAPAALPPSTRLQCWLGGREVTLRDVTVTEDSIVGRTRAGPRQPMARMALARAAVDSVRIRPPDHANWFGAGFGAGILAGIAVTSALFRLALAD